MDSDTTERLEALEASVEALENQPSADGNSETNYIVQPGEAPQIEVNEFNEENFFEIIDELVSEEGDLIVGGKGKKAKVLHKGKAGQVLTVNPKTLELEWISPEGGAAPRSVIGAVTSEGNRRFGQGFTVEHPEVGVYDINFSEPFEEVEAEEEEEGYGYTIFVLPWFQIGVPLWVPLWSNESTLAFARVLLFNANPEEEKAPVDEHFFFMAVQAE